MKIRALRTIAMLAGVAAATAPQLSAAPGDLYDGGLNNLAVYRITPTGAVSTFVSGPYADYLAFDWSGNLYVSDKTASGPRIAKITPGGAITTFASGLRPSGLAFDANGNLFAGDESTGSIFKYAPNGTRTVFATGIIPNFLTFDQAGNLFVSIAGSAPMGAGSVVVYGPNGAQKTFASGLNSPQGLAFDGSGNLYVAELTTSTILKFTPNGVRSTFASGTAIGSPRPLIFDRHGVLYEGDFANNRILKFNSNIPTTFASGVFIGGLAFEPSPGVLTNISTRALVQTGAGVTIGGFIISGTQPKQVLIRGLGPELSQSPFNIPGTLQDTTLDLHNSTTSIATNDNWQTAANANQIPTNFQPKDPRESAILITLQPGSYTAILAGKNSTTGIGLVEVYDLSNNSTVSQLTNVSTRGFVGTGNNVMIGGFITASSNSSTRVLIRALGPTLGSLGVSGTLPDPVVKLANAQGAILASNNDWKNTQQADIIATGLAPKFDADAALVATVTPGNYTAVVTGNNNTTGLALVEVYNVR